MLIAASCFFVAAFVLSAIGTSESLQVGEKATRRRRLLFGVAAASALAAALFALVAGSR